MDGKPFLSLMRLKDSLPYVSEKPVTFTLIDAESFRVVQKVFRAKEEWEAHENVRLKWIRLCISEACNSKSSVPS